MNNEVSITITAPDWPGIIEKASALVAALQDLSGANQLPVTPTGVPVVNNTLSVQQPVAPAAPAQQTPTQGTAYTREQLAFACSPLIDAGKHQEIAALLQNTFGVNALTELPEERFGEFATAIRGLGAKI